MKEKNKKIGVILTVFVALSSFTYILSSSGIGQERAVFIDERGEQKAEITFETAETPEERRTGLMNRTELQENHGMIFVYDQAEMRTFWMKNTLIPLDIIFLDSQKRVVNIEKGYPEPDTPDSQLARYSSEAPSKYVIEVNQNFTDRKGIEKGNRVEFSVN